MNRTMSLYLHDYRTPTVVINEMPHGRRVEIVKAYRTPDWTLLRGASGQIYVHRIGGQEGTRGLGQWASIPESLLRALTGMGVISTATANAYRAKRKADEERRSLRYAARAVRENLQRCGLTVSASLDRQLKKLEGAA